jgi:hypothetical protein
VVFSDPTFGQVFQALPARSIQRGLSSTGDGSSRQIDQDHIGIFLFPIKNNLLSV